MFVFCVFVFRVVFWARRASNCARIHEKRPKTPLVPIKTKKANLQLGDKLLGRHEHLAAEVAALLGGRELVLKVDAGGAGLVAR